jgi:tripartite-type tricarboxylate transporter receptor subunit TctC
VKAPAFLAAKKVQREKYQKPFAQRGEDELSTLCRFLAGLMFFAGLTASAGAQGYPGQGYPTRPVRLIVGFAAGGSTDYVARSVADRMKPLLNQPMVVENKPGANGAIAADYVAKSRSDGYTLFFSTAGAITINPSIRNDLSYDPIRDFVPVALIARTTVVLAASPLLKVAGPRELIATAKQRPGAVTVGVTGVGAVSQLVIELLQSNAEIKFQLVPYRGASQALFDLLSGHLDVMSADVPVLAPQIKAGRVKILAVSAEQRSDVLPDVPTFAELGYPDVNADNWSGILAPANTSPAIVALLNQAFNAVLADIRPRLAEDGVSVAGGTEREFADKIHLETARWRQIVSDVKSLVEP